jgi:hypothetical protein
MAVVGKIMDGETIVEQTYPCLKKSRKNGTVVLFTSLSEGCVVVSGEDWEPVGKHSTTWYDATDSSNWSDVDSVLLTTK